MVLVLRRLTTAGAELSASGEETGGHSKMRQEAARKASRKASAL